MPPSIEAQIAEARRELGRRRLAKDGARKITLQRAIVASLERLKLYDDACGPDEPWSP